MLNRMSDRWSIVMIRSDYGQTFAVERDIKSTKLWNDSVTSRLYTLAISPELVDEQLSQYIPHGLSEDTDILPRILERSEEVVFSSQTELDQHLQNMLPPKEVMLNLHFLMQDHENIFDLWPAERITVFKHLFGLLWIDEGKERIAERKREVQLTLKVKSDTQQYDIKLRRLLQEMRSRSERLLAAQRPETSKWEYHTFGDILKTYDLDMIGDEIHIEKFAIDATQITLIQQMVNTIKNQRDITLAWTEQLKHIESERTKILAEQEAVKRKVQEIERESIWLQAQLAQQPSQDQETLLYQKKEQAQLAQHQLIEPAEQHYLQQKGLGFGSFLEYYQRLQGIVVRGRELRGQQETVQDRIIQAQQRQQDNARKRETTALQQQTLEKEYAWQTEFHCDLIQGMCPYVEVLKGVALVSLRQQKEFLQQQQEQLNKEANEIQDMLTSLENQKKDNAEMLDIKAHVQQLSRKTLDERYIRYQQYQREQQQSDKELMQFAQQRREREQLQELYHQKTSSLLALKTQIEQFSQQYQLYSEQIQQLQLKWIHQWDILIYDSILQDLDIFLRAVQSLQLLIAEYTQIKYELKQLQETEKMLTDLNTIFGKELLLIVLQDFLPSLQEVMNVYLAQLVEYTVHFDLQKSWTDKLELELAVLDVHGKRPIKSLSGGQRTVLKLVWILSVASMMQTHFLFLDETINNLDAEAIAKVADLLENYMKSRQLKLYLVTHAPQIQEMQLRDSSIVIS